MHHDRGVSGQRGATDNSNHTRADEHHPVAEMLAARPPREPCPMSESGQSETTLIARPRSANRSIADIRLGVACGDCTPRAQVPVAAIGSLAAMASGGSPSHTRSRGSATVTVVPRPG